MTIRTLLAAASTTVLLSLAACAPAPLPSPPAATPPPPRPLPPPASVPAPSTRWQDRPYAVGDWRYAANRATFAAPGGPVQFILRCEPSNRHVTLARPGTLDPGKSARMIVRTSSGSAQWAVANLADLPGMVGVSLAAADPMLDRIAFSAGRFSVETDGDPTPQILPAWAELSRVVEDCRG